MPPLPSFTAQTIPGRGRGRALGTPTLNLTLSEVPGDLKEGIYACFATIAGQRHKAALHYGPRPVFKDTTACEVHLLDVNLEETPTTVTIEVIQFLREVRDFPSPEALQDQIKEDIVQTRGILEGA